MDFGIIGGLVLVLVLAAHVLRRLIGGERAEVWDDDGRDLVLPAEAVGSAEAEEGWADRVLDYEPSEVVDDHVDPAALNVRMPEPYERMVALGRFNRFGEASVYRIALLQAGIWCHLGGGHSALAGAGLHETTLYVPAGDLDRARAVIARHGSTRLGHCPACGYDLRATPDRCPECGLQV